MYLTFCECISGLHKWHNRFPQALQIIKQLAVLKQRESKARYKQNLTLRLFTDSTRSSTAVLKNNTTKSDELLIMNLEA